MDFPVKGDKDMKQVLALILTLAAVGILAQGYVSAGSKEGKTRWTTKKTGDKCKWFEAIKVPEAKSEKEPGIIELKIEFKGKELAEFFVIGDGDTDLDLVVKDATGKVVAEDVDPAERASDLCVARWTPAQDGVYSIYIINLGAVYNVATAGCN
jgi:hypothetical protein